jgi:hypothetical protein
MAIENRAYGKDLNVFTVAAQALVAQVSEANIDFSVSTVDGTCLTDAAAYNIANRDDYKISFTVAHDTSVTVVTSLIDLVGTAVAFTVTVTTTGETYSGTGLLHMGRHNIPNGGQTLEFEIIPQGTALTK